MSNLACYCLVKEERVCEVFIEKSHQNPFLLPFSQPEQRMDGGSLFECLACWLKFQQKTFWNIFSYFSQKTGFYISCKLSPVETICMKCLIQFSGKSKKNINLLPVEFAQRVVKVNEPLHTAITFFSSIKKKGTFVDICVIKLFFFLLFFCNNLGYSVCTKKYLVGTCRNSVVKQFLWEPTKYVMVQKYLRQFAWNVKTSFLGKTGKI